MGLIHDVFWSALCAAGLALAGWWLLGRLLHPVSGEAACVLLSGRGSGLRLEQTVRAFVWLRGLGFVRCTILIADVDLDPEGRELALRLAARWPDVVLWPASRLSDYISY